jgi:hypothetical protein
LPLFRLPPLMLQSKSCARLRHRTPAWAELSRPGDAGKHPIAPGPPGQFNARKTSEAFVPPKPKELDNAA